MNPNNWRISTKLLTGMGAALFIAIFAITLVNVNLLTDLMEKRVIQQELPGQLDGLTNAVEKELLTPLEAGRGVAHNLFVGQFIQSGEPEYQHSLVDAYLKDVKNTFQVDSSFIASLGQRNYYTNQGMSQLDKASSGWIDAFIAKGDDSELVLDTPPGGVLTAFINVRVSYQGEVVGIAGVGQKVDSLSRMISQFRLGEKGRVFLINDQGNVVVHPEQDKVGQSLPSAIGAAAGQSLMGSKSFSYYDDKSGDLIYATQPLELLPGWQLVASVSKSELYSGVYSAIQNSTLSGIVLGVIMLGMIVVLVKRIVNPIRIIADSLTEIGQRGGDLTQRIPFDRNDELGDLIKGFNSFMDKLHATVSEVILNNEQLSGSLREVVQNMSSAAGQAGETQHNTDRVAAAVHEMSTTVQEIARNTHQAADASKDSEGAAADGSKVIGQSISNIQELNSLMQASTQSVKDLADDVTRISAVLEVIRSISEQTNLLALNAAIEAARAGELGRGFAVVADEVRALAQKTQASTDEIHQTIERLQSSASDAVAKIDSGMAKTQEGVGLAEQAGVALEDIRGKASGITDMNIQIATATEEQSTVTEDINMNVQTISELASTCAEQIRICDEECARIAEMADNIRSIMGQFKV